MFDENDFKQLADETYTEPAAAAAFLDNDEVAKFLELHGANKGFECAIFQYVKSPISGNMTRAHQITYTDVIPGATPIVQQFGPGEFDWQLVTKNAEVRAGGGKPIVVKRIFVGPHWDKVHRIYKRESDRRERKERMLQLQEDAEEMRILGAFGGAQPAQGMGITEMLKVIELVRPAGQAPAAAGPQQTDPLTLLIMTKMLDKPGTSLTDIAALVTSLAGPAGAIFSRLTAPRAPGPFDNLGMELVKSIAERKLEDMNPAPPERHWIADVIEGFSSSLPTIVTVLASLPKDAAKTTAAAAIKNHPKGPELLKAAVEDPEARAYLTAYLDKRFDAASVDKVLEALGTQRDTPRPAPAAGAAPEDEAET